MRTMCTTRAMRVTRRRASRRGRLASMEVASPDDLVGAVARDRRMSGYRVRRQGDGWIELEVVAQRSRMPVLLVLAWPEVWKDAAQLKPHLVRARSGNYGLMLVGTDAEFEAAQLDAL